MKYTLWTLLIVAVIVAGVGIAITIVSRSMPQERTVTLYYYNEADDRDASGNVQCSAAGLVPVPRVLDTSGMTRDDVVSETLRLLLQGRISMAEEDAGLVANFPIDGVALNGVLFEGNNGETLRVNFSDLFGKSSGGSCRVNILRSQIEATAKQFGSQTIVIEPEDLFQP